MTEPISFLLRRHANRGYHVELVLDQVTHHGGRGIGIVGIIAIDQHIDIRLYVGEHATHHVALALEAFAAHHGSGIPRDAARVIGGVVVVHVDGRVGQAGAEPCDHLRHGEFLIVARNQNGDGGTVGALPGQLFVPAIGNVAGGVGLQHHRCPGSRLSAQ